MKGSTISASRKLKKLAALEEEAKQIRTDLGISQPREVIYQASEDLWSDNEVIVEADGYGGATLLVVEGNYPIDYVAKRQQRYVSENEACDEAERLALK